MGAGWTGREQAEVVYFSENKPSIDKKGHVVIKGMTSVFDFVSASKKTEAEYQVPKNLKLALKIQHHINNGEDASSERNCTFMKVMVGRVSDGARGWAMVGKDSEGKLGWAVKYLYVGSENRKKAKRIFWNTIKMFKKAEAQSESKQSTGHCESELQYKPKVMAKHVAELKKRMDAQMKEAKAIRIREKIRKDKIEWKKSQTVEFKRKQIQA